MLPAREVIFRVLWILLIAAGWVAEIALLVCNKPQAPVVERARKAGIDCFLFEPKAYASRGDYEREIAAELERRDIDLIVLAGYMLLLTPVLVDLYAGRMINIHPSLLPLFQGLTR